MTNEIDVKKAKKYVVGFTFLAVLLFFLFTAGKWFENVDNTEIAVIQTPVSGDLVVKGNTPGTSGTVWQGWGKVTKYKKSYQYWFSSKKGEGEQTDQSIKVRFNDGGHAQLSGSIRIDMPLDEKSILALHIRYGSQEAIEHALIGQLITKSVYMTGPMMSSKESNAERRNELIGYIEDQAINGVYKTYVTTSKVKDPMDETQERTVSVVKISKDSAGVPLVAEKSPVKEFNLRLYNLTINSIDYDKDVEAQIKTQQQSIMAVQTAIAMAKKAEQDAFTVEQQGKAEAAKAKWDQEVLKAKAVTEAEQNLEVATLDRKTAEQEKQANILRGEGEGAYKRNVMQANGALEQKLATYEKVQGFWADAFSKYGGNIVPQIQSGGASGNGATNFMELMGMKAARDLGLDLTNNKK